MNPMMFSVQDKQIGKHRKNLKNKGSDMILKIKNKIWNDNVSSLQKAATTKILQMGIHIKDKNKW